MLDHCLDKIEELGVCDEVYIISNDKFASHFEQRQHTYTGSLSIVVVNDGTTSNEDRLGAL